MPPTSIPRRKLFSTIRVISRNRNSDSLFANRSQRRTVTMHWKGGGGQVEEQGRRRGEINPRRRGDNVFAWKAKESGFPGWAASYELTKTTPAASASPVIGRLTCRLSARVPQIDCFNLSGVRLVHLTDTQRARSWVMGRTLRSGFGLIPDPLFPSSSSSSSRHALSLSLFLSPFRSILRSTFLFLSMISLPPLSSARESGLTPPD